MFPAYTDFLPLELSHVMMIGQSNALGGGSTTGLSTRQKYDNRMFKTGVMGGNSAPADYTEVVPLLETIESAATGFSDYVAFKSNGARPSLMTCTAVGSAAYAAMAKGTAPYTLGIRHMREARQRFGNHLVARALLSIHGENDAASATYGADIRQWQLDYETDINARTGRTGTLPIFHTQAAYPGYAAQGSSLGMLSEYIANPTKTVLVGPRYFLSHGPIGGSHMIEASHQRLGEYYGKAYYKQVFENTQWVPLYPSIVSRSGAVITLTFIGNVGALVLDTVNVVDPGNYGFTYVDDTSSATILSVALQSTNQVVVTLTGTPTGANKKIQYGFNGATEGGPTTGKRGCLRDQDPEASPNGHSLVNWCVYFEEAAT